jgi:hypothetical protein
VGEGWLYLATLSTSPPARVGYTMADHLRTELVAARW